VGIRGDRSKYADDSALKRCARGVIAINTMNKSFFVLHMSPWKHVA
jgi:hypothetical protein